MEKRDEAKAILLYVISRWPTCPATYNVYNKYLEKLKKINSCLLIPLVIKYFLSKEKGDDTATNEIEKIATSEIEIALEILPEEFIKEYHIYNTLGSLYQREKDFDNAKRCYNKILEEKERCNEIKKIILGTPSTEEVIKTYHIHYALGSLYQREKDFDNAKRCYNKILEEKEKYSDNVIGGAYFHLGDMAYIKRSYREAINYFSCCIKFDPLHKKANKLMSICREKEMEENINRRKVN